MCASNQKSGLVVCGFLLTLFAANGALAQSDTFGGLFVEPAITYEVGQTSVDYPSPFSSSDGTTDGFGIGLVLGVHMYEAFYLGLDARYSMPQFEDSTVNYDAKAVSTNWGPVLGIQMPDYGLRVWGAYLAGGVLDPEKSSGLDVKFTGATGYRVGAGLRVKMVSANLEYQNLEYDKTELQQIGPFASAAGFSSVNLDSASWIVSVSFPLEL